MAIEQGLYFWIRVVSRGAETKRKYINANNDKELMISPQKHANDNNIFLKNLSTITRTCH